MQLYEDWQQRFAAVLTRPDEPVPHSLTDPLGRLSERRFAIYRNNVVASLVDALVDSFPATHRIVGDAFFRAMARSFALHAPPSSPVLLDFGAGFADFVQDFAPAAGLPYLADVCRLERAWLDSYHAADAEPIEIAELAQVPEHHLQGLRFALHPSLRLICSRFPVVSLWRTNIGDSVAVPLDLECGECAMIVRPRADVEVRIIQLPAAEFIVTLQSGNSVQSAAEAALALNAEFDLAAMLRDLFSAGLCIGVIDARRCRRDAKRGNHARQ